MAEQDQTKKKEFGESSAAYVGSVMEKRPLDGREDASNNCDMPGTSQGASSGMLLSKTEKTKQKMELWQKEENRKGESEETLSAQMRERGEGDLVPIPKSLKKDKLDKSTRVQKVVFDCSFDGFMTNKGVKQLVRQIQHCYFANTLAGKPLQLYVCGMSGRTIRELERIDNNYKEWDIHIKDQLFTEDCDNEEMVYLSSESPNVLQKLDESKVYVIEGLIDHHLYKRLTYTIAKRRRFSHAHLPIPQTLQQHVGKVLSMQHVFEILLRFTETKDWQSSVSAVLSPIADHQDRADPGPSGDSHRSQVADEEDMDIEDNIEEEVMDLDDV